MNTGERFTFQSPYALGPTGDDAMTDEEFANRKGTEAEVVAYYPDQLDGWDTESLPVYRIRFTADGHEMYAFPEEVETPEDHDR